jgi:hypothetical protein
MLIRLLELPGLGPPLALGCGHGREDDLGTCISINDFLRGVGIHIRVKLERFDRLDLEELLETLGCHVGLGFEECGKGLDRDRTRFQRVPGRGAEHPSSRF